MKKYIFTFCIASTFASCMISLWEHDIRLAAAWASACLGWFSALLATILGE